MLLHGAFLDGRPIKLVEFCVKLLLLLLILVISECCLEISLDISSRNHEQNVFLLVEPAKSFTCCAFSLAASNLQKITNLLPTAATFIQSAGFVNTDSRLEVCSRSHFPSSSASCCCSKGAAAAAAAERVGLIMSHQ